MAEKDSCYISTRRNGRVHHEVIKMYLDETVFQDFSGLSHPLPSPVRIYRSIGL